MKDKKTKVAKDARPFDWDRALVNAGVALMVAGGACALFVTFPFAVALFLMGLLVIGVLLAKFLLVCIVLTKAMKHIPHR